MLLIQTTELQWNIALMDFHETPAALAREASGADSVFHALVLD